MSPCVESTECLESLPLTPLDQTAARIYITNHLSFSLTEPARGLLPLQNGVNRLFSALPMLAGTLVPEVDDEKNYRFLPYVGQSREDPLLREAHHSHSISTAQIAPWNSTSAEAHENESFSSWHESCVSLRPVEDGGRREPVLRFQVNIMTDGLVLSMSYHHSVLDGTGAAIVLEALGECCRGSGSDELPPLLSKLANDEVKFRKVLLETKPIGQSYGSNPKQLSDDTASHGYTEGPNDAYPPIPITRKFSFCPIQIRHLKSHCNSLLSRPVLSGNDILTALLATAIHQLNGSPAPSGELLMAVNLRERLHSHQFSTYLGNMFTVVQLPLPLDHPHVECRTNDNIHPVAQFASHIRQQLASIDEQYIWWYIESKRDPKGSAWAASPFNIGIISWRHMNIYSIDFGPTLGHIDAFEQDLVPFNNTCTILPQHKTDDPRWEVNITLANKTRFDALVKNPFFKKLTGSPDT